MRSKTPLVFMEQLVMVLVFALAAALCMQVFVLSDKTSERNDARDRALLEAQNAAEALKGGEDSYFSEMLAESGDDGGYIIFYNEDWQPVEESGEYAYSLSVSMEESDLTYLWKAEVCVYEEDGDMLVSLPVSGQEDGEVESNG